ncbi:MAG: hypothetical protein EAZ16_09345 [Sphingobacteriales bacterium]|jgi:hypothetical protein|nr:MAG: hypothetical protein EAZ16_09345 [Sphingobacteriales bacterium]
MKKLMIGLVLGAFIITNTAFANNSNTVNDKVQTSFKQEFATAQNVVFSKTNNYIKAAFTLNNQVMEAYYTADGEMIGVSKNLLSTELPIGLQVDLKRDYADYWISDLFEFATESNSNYFITVENADQKITLQSNGNEWIVYKKAKKL